MRKFYFVLIILVNSCGQKEYNLGGYSINYAHGQEKGVIVDHPRGGVLLTIWRNDSTFEKKYLYNGALIIQPYVSEALYDSLYIVIAQKPLDSICE